METYPVNIDPLRRPLPVTLKSVTRRSASEEREPPSLGGAVKDEISQQDLVNRLKKMEDVRPDVVELGRRLAQDPSYPPDNVVERLAEVLAEMPIDWLTESDSDESSGADA